MSQLILKNAKCYIDGTFIEKDIFISDGKIASFSTPCCAFEQIRILDCAGYYVVPGFIDIHTHGANGVDINRASEEDLSALSAFFASKGTTAFLASVLTDSQDNTLRILQTIAHYKMLANSGAVLLGAHLEGPFLSKEKKGAMPEAYLQNADIDLFERYLNTGVVKYITVAPEIAGGQEFIEYAAKKIPVAIGHSAASYCVALEAVQNGAVASTHTFNGMRGLDRVEPAVLGAVLESDIYNELIADGRHVHPANMRLLYRLKGNQKIIAITDSMEATGLPDGVYQLGETGVTLCGEDAFISGTTTRAGSVLCMDKALKNVIKYMNISLEEALPMFTQNPADLFSLNKGYIRIGYDADFVLMDSEYTIQKTIVGGQIVFEA